MMRRLQSKILVLITVVAIALFAAGVEAATQVVKAREPKASYSCAECQKIDSVISTRTENLNRTREVLKKNQDYLVQRPNRSASIAIKVRSNIVVSMLQIETLQNEIEFYTKGFKSRGCFQCPSRQ